MEHLTGLHETWWHATYLWSSSLVGQKWDYVLGGLAFVPPYQHYAQHGLAGSSKLLYPHGILGLGNVDISHGFYSECNERRLMLVKVHHLIVA